MKLNQYGSVNGVTVGLIATVILLIASLAFGIWSFSGRQKYKDDTGQIVNSAVSQAKTSQQTTDNQKFAVEEQSPLTQYTPASYGTVTLSYPKNWSAYVDSSGASGLPVVGYFYPGILPSVSDSGSTSFALRLQVQDESYTRVVQSFNNDVTNGYATVTAYSLPKLPNIVGVKVVGEIENGIMGTLVILPLRTTALEVWTEGSQYLTEFNNDILPSLSFSP